MLKAADNPPVLFPPDSSLPSLGGCWMVAHTLARFEKALAHDLVRLGISYFLPLAERVSTSGGRRRKSLIPLFAGYVFICCEAEDKAAIVRTNRLCSLLDVSDQRMLVSQLTDIKQLLDSGLDISAIHNFSSGVRCRVRSGALAGVEGIVDRLAANSRLVVNVDMLGRGASVEIDADLLEVIE